MQKAPILLQLHRLLPVTFTVLTFAHLVAATAALAEGSKAPPGSSEAKSERRHGLAVVFASDGSLHQPSIDYYRAVYRELSQIGTWEALPMAATRQALGTKTSQDRVGGIPVIDREAFRAGLPHKASKRSGGKVVPGTRNREVQRLLDTLGAPSAVVVDCSRLGQKLLNGCALYYYDRVAARVIASVVKKFTAGATDATVWATPMVKDLEDGIAASQRAKDQAIIEELLARNEDETNDERLGVIAFFGKGDRIALNNGWSHTLAGAGLELGFMSDGVGVDIVAAELSWRGDGAVSAAERMNYGLNMQFRSRALEKLLWYFALGGGKETDKLTGATADDRLQVDGVYVEVRPAVGLEVSELFALDVGLSWRWFFEQSSSKGGTLRDAGLSSANAPGLSLRASLTL